MTRPHIGVQLEDAAAAAAPAKFGVFGVLVDAILSLGRLLVCPKVARAMRWRRAERSRSPTPFGLNALHHECRRFYRDRTNKPSSKT
jgi:hypothetical protein